MNAPARIVAAGSEWSLWDVLEINGQAFMAAVQEMRRVQTLMDQASDQEAWKTQIPDETRPFVVTAVAGIVESTQQLYARSAKIAAERLAYNVEHNAAFTWREVRDAMVDIDSRLRDELGLVKLFVLNDQESIYLQPGHQLLGQVVADRFPSIVFEMEESAKCLALGRATASAFHSMRAVEVMIGTLRTFLSIPEPEKPAERNWSIVLKAIREAIDARYPMRARKPGSEGAKADVIYVTLDAIKNPWRNATMHVEQTYQPFEASHILQCVNMLAIRMAELTDETGVGDVV